MDDYTALHRHLGQPRGPVDDDLLDAAVRAHLEETDDLDWKKPPRSEGNRAKFIDKDFLEDVAAFANADGGTIVIGVDEEDSAATERIDAGEWSDGDLRTLRSVVASQLHPPVLGLRTHRLNNGDKRALIVVVPPSLDRPHFLQSTHKNNQQYYAARIRVGSGSRWMTEREIAEAYRRRFAEQRDAAEALNRLFEGAFVGRGRPRGVVVARPRIPLNAPAELTRENARRLMQVADREAANMMRRKSWRPLDSIDLDRIRPGLRRWIGPAKYWDEAGSQAVLRQDGAITLAATLDGHYEAAGVKLDEGTFASWRLEALVVDALCLVRAVASRTGSVEYEVRVGLAPWRNELRMVAADFDPGLRDNHAEVIQIFEPVDTTITLDAGLSGLLTQTEQLARDCINQGGIDELMLLRNMV
ncbi:hypothetical protein GCM10009853_032130 [Glycomyces scopariae]